MALKFTVMRNTRDVGQHDRLTSAIQQGEREAVYNQPVEVLRWDGARPTKVAAWRNGRRVI